ncbi:HlyD family secretion protein [Flavobacterium aestivum]|uniref:HlyD family secretion protein n=1 Tax=Flavobacterium aestivum TaxID=3003257 RepID=UPI002285F89F|nr:HlyD family efflux transporter periplasmic adaptor subunit [Flavobacterium aestivum]
MKFNFYKTSIIAFCITLSSCGNSENVNEASGTFEATETIVSAEANGKILKLTINEGDQLGKGQKVGFIDSTQLHLSKMQLKQNGRAILSGRPDSKVQIEALQKERENAVKDKKRIENLVKGDVASQKQLDDANYRIAIIQSKIDALSSQLATTTNNLNEQSGSVGFQLAQVEDQLKKCNIINSVSGTVLTKYANEYEMATVGKPIYKIADLSTLKLRAYITASQFAKIKIGDVVKINVDAENGKSKTYSGTVEWINSKAEFTPKTIQTKDERANLVYAVKIRVKNDGTLKIGMYGDVVF